MARRVSSLLRELAPHWPIVLICPEGGESGAENGVSLTEEINVERAGEWMYLPAQYDVRPLVKAASSAVAAHRPQLALFWGGMEYLHAVVPNMPLSVSDRVDCMTLAAWRSLTHGRSYREIRQRLSNLAYVLRYEFQMRHESAATVVVGAADADVLTRVVRVPNVHVIPNGVDLPEFGTVKRSARPTVMFTGVMTYRPNVEAVLYFADDVWPSVHRRMPDSVFQIVGRSPAPEVLALTQRAGIEVLPDVKSIQRCLAEAWLAVAPMQTGAGIKNKILEAWSVCTPVAMTPIATNGLSDAPAELLLTAEGNELADMIVQLLANSARRAALGQLARTTAQTSFSWASQGIAFDRLLREVEESSKAVGYSPRYKVRAEA